ncbi:DUF805 domain-containing protein [Deinococcus hohokamensis]|uniref:DUF805 domain-containing protein n=1 Tax=Deinococcus hohokamensis TaxID=309883 RepID=A0ABV9IEE5_9DEIO
MQVAKLLEFWQVRHGEHPGYEKILIMNPFQLYFIDVLRTRYADFTGRARRSEYWYFVLFSGLIQLPFSVLSAVNGELPLVLDILDWGITLALIVPSWAIGARRMHDVGRSGWWQLITLVPIVGWILWIVWTASDGQEEDNNWGRNPKHWNSSGALA